MQPKAILTSVSYVVMIVTLVVGMIGYNLAMIQGVYIEPESPIATTIYSIIIIYVLASVPFALWYFNRKIKAITSLPNNGGRESYYVRYGIMRLVLIGVGLVLSVFAYFLLRQTSLMWLAGMAAIALIFCRPNGARIESEINPKDKLDDDVQE